jgi:myo-inositol-1(or 4)-monophosphatase
MAKKPSRQDLERIATQAALKGAAIHLKFYEKGLKPTFKGEVNLVTRADYESQKAIVGTIAKAFPSHDFLGEEENLGHNKSMDGPIWIIDPLDGTTNYAHAFPMFGVSIGFRVGGETTFGLVYHPLLKELFIAHKGKGTKRNGKKVRVSKNATLNRSLLATGFPYDRRTSAENNLNYFIHFEMAAQCVRRAGAAAIDLAYISCGRVDGFWEAKLSPWDITAGILLTEEAGGKVTDYSGKPLTDLWGGEIVASNGLVHDEILQVMRNASRSPIPNPYASTSPSL